MPQITYHKEAVIEEDDLDLTLLEVSLKHGIPHIHACGGNARCSTCRVMVLANPDNLSPRNGLEAELAQKKGLESNIRLACQTKVCGSVTVRRLVLDDHDVDLVLSQPGRTTGREGEIAVLFSDIRSFTSFTEQNLAYDVVHTLNRYFRTMGETVLRNDGYLDKYIGDGLMALFGLHGETPEESCMKAVRCGLDMLNELGGVNQYLTAAFGPEWTLRIGIGVHFGAVILGEFGHPDKMQFTALGDVVNMASRLENVSRYAGTPLVISQAVQELVGDQLRLRGPFETALKGKSGRYMLYEVHHLLDDSVAPLDLRQRLELALRDAVSRRTAPMLLRLAFHDAGTYQAASGTGGPNGSIRLEAELGHPLSKGLEPAIELLRPIKEQLPEVSWADLIAVAGAIAVHRCGGPEIELPLGRIDSDTACDPDTLPHRDHDASALRRCFAHMGLSVKDMVVLSGAHTLGRVDGLPYTPDLFEFNNTFFRLLLDDSEQKAHFLGTDRLLVQDPECRRYVELYARDEGAFRRDFANSYRKMTLLGTDLQA